MREESKLECEQQAVDKLFLTKSNKKKHTHTLERKKVYKQKAGRNLLTE